MPKASKQSSLEAYNRLHGQAKPLSMPDFKWEHVDSLVKYNYLDSLDIYLRQVPGVGNEPILGGQAMQELAFKYRARSLSGR